MAIWNVTSVNETPELELVHWAVMELASGDRHFAGYNITEGEGRASSKIVEFDKNTLVGKTRSGRVYKLVGAPGIYGDGAYVWERWCRINGETSWTDVSTQVI